MRAGEIWQRKPNSKVRHRIKLIKYLEEDCWAVEFIYQDGKNNNFNDVIELCSSITETLDGKYIYKNYEKIDDEEMTDENRGSMGT